MAYILTYRGNWADEIDLEGFMLMKDGLYNQYKTFVDAHPEILNERMNMYVGTNEDTHYRLSDLDIKYIADEDMETIIKAIGITMFSGYGDYGPFPYILDDVNNWCEKNKIEYLDW